MFVFVWNGQQARTQKRDGPFRAGRVLQPQNSKLDHGGQCRALLVSTAKAKSSTVHFVRKCLEKLREKDRREMVSSWRTTSVCHFAPLFYLAHCTQTPYSRHKLLESKFTHHTHVHAHTHGDYSHSLRSQMRLSVSFCRLSQIHTMSSAKTTPPKHILQCLSNSSADDTTASSARSASVSTATKPCITTAAVGCALGSVTFRLKVCFDHSFPLL
jgi:hypothetical protein